MSYKIGLTGGIGSGKSTVARAFSKLGVPVLSADKISHELTHKGELAYLEIVKQFGSCILLPDGDLDRAKLGDLIFSDSALKTRLEGILHPLIMQSMHQRTDAVKAPYVIMDVPLLIGTAEQNMVDRILVIDCTQSSRIKRIKQRSGWSEKKIVSVMAAQLPRQALLEAADDVVDNSLGIKDLNLSVDKLHLKYQKLGASKLIGMQDQPLRNKSTT